MSDDGFIDEDLPRSKYYDKNFIASKPGRIRINGEMYYYFLKQFKNKHKRIGFAQDYYPIFEEHLQRCDSNPALVLTIDPNVIIAAATEDIDDVLFLEFDPDILTRFPIKVGDRLVSVNSYYRKEDILDPILVEGAQSSNVYGSTFPLIGDFLCEAPSEAHRARGRIPAAEWLRLEQLIQRRLSDGRTENHPGNPFDYIMYLYQLADKQYTPPLHRRIRDVVDWIIIIGCVAFLAISAIIYFMQKSIGTE